MRLFATANPLGMNAVKLLGLLCVTALVASAAVGAEGDGIVVAFTFFPLLRSETEALEKRQSAVDRIFDRYVSEICITLDEISHIYNRTLVALFRQNTRVLRDMSRRSAKLCREAEARRRAGVTLQRGGVSDMGAWLFGTRATIYLAEMCEALERIVRPACEHVEHDGGALTREQTVALMRLNDGIDAMTHKVSEALSERTSSAETSGGVLPVRRQRDDVLDLVREYTREQIACGGGEEDTATDLLFLTLLGETKTLTLRMSNLLKIKRYSQQASHGE